MLGRIIQGRLARLGSGFLLLAAACSTAPEEQKDFTAVLPAPVPDRVAMPPAPAASSTLDEDPDGEITALQEERLVYFDDRQGSIGSLENRRRQYQTDSLNLNFIDTPADHVARAVIGEALGETVAIGEGVTGTITLTSSGLVEVGAALDALESVLAASGLVLIEKPSGFLLTSIGTAQSGSLNIQGRNSAIGYGAVFLRAENTTPSTLAGLVRPFLSDTVELEPNDATGLITIRGAQTDINQALEAIRLFDTPALNDRVAGLFELHHADTSIVAEEIRTLIAAENPSNDRAVQLIELPRLNQLFVLARTRQQFDQVRRWIERLDVASGGDERRLRYYTVLNTPAETLADQLMSVFTGRTGAQMPLMPATSTVTGQTSQGGDTASRGSSGGYGGGYANGLSIVPDQLNNALIIRATDTEYRELVGLLERMDVMPPQVLIEATIAEVTLSDDLRFGVRWFLESGDFSFTLSDNEGGAVGPVFPGFSTTFFDGDKAGVALSALSSVTDVTVLSAPSIMVQNNRPANLQVGDEVPIVTQQAQSTADPDAPIVSTVQLRETGVILEVKPRINASDMIVLEISQEVSEVANTVTSGIDSPTIRQRRFTSTVAVADNSTVALGGLIRDSRTDNESGLPILKNTPVVGNLFKTTDTDNRRTELIVFLTPRIIRNQGDADRALDYLRGQLGGLYQRLEAAE